MEENKLELTEKQFDEFEKQLVQFESEDNEKLKELLKRPKRWTGDK